MISLLGFCFFATNPVVASNPTVIVGLGDCKKLIEHLARSDISYKEGYDIRGKKVAAARYQDKSQKNGKNAIEFDVAIDIAKKYNLRVGSVAAKLSVAKVTIKNNKVFLNGDMLKKKDEADLALRCQSLLSSK
tara:strand:+ start:714 stop:1112 length:399 start_codon:yes stop_codon:yes gene_type:complete